MATGRGDNKINLDSPELSLIDSGIHSMRDVPLASHLQSINLHSNYIQRIQGLELVRNLRHLDLSANQITEISGLDGLASLKTLNLSCNLISVVEGLSFLRYVCVPHILNWDVKLFLLFFRILFQLLQVA